MASVARVSPNRTMSALRACTHARTHETSTRTIESRRRRRRRRRRRSRGKSCGAECCRRRTGDWRPVEWVEGPPWTRNTREESCTHAYAGQEPRERYYDTTLASCGEAEITLSRRWNFQVDGSARIGRITKFSIPIEFYIYNILNLEFDFRRIRNSMQNALSLENNPINFSRQLRNIFDTILNDRAAKRK